MRRLSIVNFEIEPRRDLAEDQAQLRRSADLPDLVEDRRDGFRAKRFRVGRIFLVPEAQRFGISRRCASSSIAKIVVGVEARQIDERRVLARDQRRDAMKEKMLQPRSPLNPTTDV